MRGSAKTIFEQNLLGYSCARVCPVEVLCVGSCVYNPWHKPPITIGRLQRYATEYLLDHEARHALQYAWCLGPMLLPLYAAASGWSWVRTGDWWSRNVFERRAGLAAGGYTDRGTRSQRRRALAAARAGQPMTTTSRPAGRAS